MICDWCGLGIVDYADHFARPETAGCKKAALDDATRQALERRAAHESTIARTPEQRERIRRATIRGLARTNRRDRLEGSVATYARPGQDRQARS